MEMNTDRDWLFKKAEQEDGCTVSVGGLAAGLGAVQGLVLTASSNELIVTIHFDGRVTVNPKYSTDEAARAFWDAVRRLGRMDTRDPRYDPSAGDVVLFSGPQTENCNVVNVDGDMVSYFMGGRILWTTLKRWREWCGGATVIEAAGDGRTRACRS
jgi:hypothetical protein